jgi:hypothetical protein
VATLAVLAFVLATPATGLSQVPGETPPADSLTSEVIMTPEDTIPHGPSPMGAFWRSFLIPGWGQLASDRPGRAVFYASLQAATIYMVVRTQGRINEAEDAGNEVLVDAREEQREDWIALAVFWSLASAVDAWVGAHMWGFEGEVVPPPDGSAGLAVRYRVPVRGF